MCTGLLTIIAAVLPSIGGNPLEVDHPVVQIRLETDAPAIVHPGELISWSVSVRVLTADNLGLAGIGFDLVQTEGVGPLILEPANFIATEMAPFNRPRGIANKGIGGVGCGFGGTQFFNVFGGADLYSLGGIQNNFGIALSPAQGIATDAVIVQNIAVAADQIIASGIFEAPNFLGNYRVDLGVVVANVFLEANSPPQSSTAIPAAINAIGSIPFQVACGADFNGVNGVTVQDIFDFLTAWLAGSSSADFNNVNGVTVQDIFDFLTAWLAGC